MYQQKSKKYNIEVLKKRVVVSDVDEWINVVVKGEWTKKDLKNTVVYTFFNIDDAFKFKLKWPSTPK